MREHPIPQDVTGYKFHIVGNMTLKQFAEVGAGVLIAVILYNTNLLVFIKWPLILLSVGLGGMAAFVPIEERPLDHWIVTFFRRLYNPTKFYWRREPAVPFAMAPEKNAKKTEEQPFEIDLTPARQQRIRDYLASVSQPRAYSEAETAEHTRISEILNTFDQLPVENVQPTRKKEKPQLTTRVRKLSVSQQQPVKKQTVFRSAAKTVQETPAATQPVLQAASPDIQNIQQPKTVRSTEKETTAPSQPPIEVFSDDTPPPAAVSQSTPQVPQTQVTTNNKLPFPNQNFAPNTLFGMVLTGDNKLVDRAVITIKNTQGKTVSALKTNLLGQFSATTPLPNGSYILSVEKQGLSFPQRGLSLNGSVLQPLELKAA